MSDVQFKDDVVRMLRTMGAEIERLKKLTMNDVPAGTIKPYAAPSVRPNYISRSRKDSIAAEYTTRYELNEVGTGYVEERNKSLSLRGILAGATPPNIPRLGQPGGQVSEGSYGVYFKGSGDCRIDLPLQLNTQRGWTIDVIFSPDALPQTNGCIVYNGTPGTNGFGLMVGAATGGSGSKLIYRADGATNQWRDSGVTLKVGQWFHVVVVADDPTDNIIFYVSTIDPATKKFSHIVTTLAQAAPVTPTGGTVLGADSASGTREFKGYIDDISFYADEINAFSAVNRIWTSLCPLPPNGWLLCDGTEVSASKYSLLYSVLGTSEGTPANVGGFILPNISGAHKYIIKT